MNAETSLGQLRQPHFPSNNDKPRVWVLTAAESPVAVAVARQLLDHGDKVLAGIHPALLSRQDERTFELQKLTDELEERDEARSRFKISAYNIR